MPALHLMRNDYVRLAQRAAQGRTAHAPGRLAGTGAAVCP
nr:hypothetical protein [Tanacetum cinerariifolium]